MAGLARELLELAAPKVVSPSRIARYYFHECERFLRYSSTPVHLRSVEGVPAPAADLRPVTRAILEGGFVWEEQVVSRHLKGQVELASGEGQPLRDRVHTAESTRQILKSLKAGRFIYQPTLITSQSFYDRYRIDSTVVRVSDCRPDLVQAVETDGEVELRVIDIKASPGLKLAHRIQAVLYSLILSHALKEWGLEGRRVSNTPGIWLAGADEAEHFDIRTMLPPMETFLEDELERVVTQPAGSAPWHLYYRCEWCEYFSICRTEMTQTDNVSRVPYLSTHAKRFLGGRDPEVQTVHEFDALLNSDHSAELDDCASLRGNQGRLRLQTSSLLSGQTEVQRGYSISMPVSEHVRIVLTLQREPVSGKIYAFGIYAQGLRDVLGQNPEVSAGVALSDSEEGVGELERRFVRELSEILKAVDDFNAARTQAWRDQKSLQVFTFDSYERDFLIDLLARRINDPTVASEALQLFFFFQRPELVQAEDHPAEEVFFPVSVVLEAVRDHFALPVEVSYRFADLAALLQPSEYAFEFKDSEFFSFQLSNQMRSDAIFMVWHHSRPEYVSGIKTQVVNRLRATNSMISGVRERLAKDKVLFGWPPKFRLPAGLGFHHAALSRMAFMTQYESVVSYLALRQGRMAPLDERLKAGLALRVVYTGGSRFTIDPGHADHRIEATGFPSWLLTEDSNEGLRTALSYDDYQNRSRAWVPKNLPIALGSITQLESTLEAPNRALQLALTTSPAFAGLRLRGRYILHPRYTDFNSSKAIAELAAMDAENNPYFLRLVTRPLSCVGPERNRHAIAAHARAMAAGAGMTKSQLHAFDSILDGDFHLVWGPPGTGKTHFLALSVLCLAAAHQHAGQRFRVLVSAFTHAAIDNCLRKASELAISTGAFRTVSIAKLKRVELPRMNSVVLLEETAAEAWMNARDVCVVGGTAWSLRKAFRPETADLLVIDEGSQVKVPESAVMIRRLRNGGRLIIAGDDRQLPPIVHGLYPDPAAGEPLLHRSIFECLRIQDPLDNATSILLENFRMNHTLCEYPASQIYVPEYDSATATIAQNRLRLLSAAADNSLLDSLLDPSAPLVVAVLEGVQATAENQVEADLVADLAVRLRDRLMGPGAEPYPATAEGDAAFWLDGLFVVSPHHAQINAIRQALARRRRWASRPFVDTVDRMQGQECDAVIVSYGVADVEYAMNEKEFIYSLNRLNVSITRARAKTVVFLTRPLIEPPIQAFEDDRSAAGIAFMQGLVQFARRHGETVRHPLPGLRANLVVSSVGDHAAVRNERSNETVLDRR